MFRNDRPKRNAFKYAITNNKKLNALNMNFFLVRDVYPNVFSD